MYYWKEVPNHVHLFNILDVQSSKLWFYICRCQVYQEIIKIKKHVKTTKFVCLNVKNVRNLILIFNSRPVW